MGRKVNPISNRLGIIRGWDSNWYGGKNYGDSLLEDSKIRKYLNARLAKARYSFQAEKATNGETPPVALPSGPPSGTGAAFENGERP